MDESLHNLQNWMLDHYGLLISDDLLEHRVKRLIKISRLNETNILKALQANQADVVTLALDAFTVQESYFFRDGPLFNHLKNEIFPKLIQEKIQQHNFRLTIWSVGCAKGEETYSIAIILHQLLPAIYPWEIQLIGSDVNQIALEHARAGVYTQPSLRTIDKDLLHTYFDKVQSGYQIKAFIRDMARFNYVNLANLPVQKLCCDMILCRNVFIYLNKQTIETALRYFYDSLNDGGVLFLGPSDLLSYHQHSFRIDIINDLYQLGKNLVETVLPQRVNLIKSPPPKLASKSSFSLSTSALELRAKGEIDIHRGEMLNAHQHLSQSIALDPLDPTSHFLIGLVYIDLKKTTLAIRHLQKALYLNPKFPEAAYHLGLLYLTHHQWDKGMKLLNSALFSAKSRDGNAIVLCSKGTMTEFIQAIHENITYFQGIKHE